MPRAWLLLLAAGCGQTAVEPDDPTETNVSMQELAWVAPGWKAEIVAQLDESYAGWSVEIGDANGDGRPDILTGTAPDSRVYLFHKRHDGSWRQRVLLDHGAGTNPGLVLGVHIADLDGDGLPEILAGTGEEDSSVARLDVLRTSGGHLTVHRSLQAAENISSYTHGLATADLDGDGVLDIVSSYCGNGEVIRYGVTPPTMELRAKKVLQLSGSGEGVLIADVDGDGKPEAIISNGYRVDAARVEIHDLDPVTGDPVPEPRLIIDGYDGHAAFYASFLVGDLDGDGEPELIVGWKWQQAVNRATLLAYHVTKTSADVVYRLTEEDPDLDLAYFEKMMAIADLDGDGQPELVVSTRGDNFSENVPSSHLGRVYLFRARPDAPVERELLVDFDDRLAESSWLAVGDADGDGRPDLVLATGKGDRRLPGTSWVVALHKVPSELDHLFR